MNSLVVKEIRLLLPAFGMALLLAVFPIILLSTMTGNSEVHPIVVPLLCFGAMLMALTSFGREFSMGTFPLLLAIPVQRARTWWTKIAVLTAATIIVFGAYLVPTLLRHLVMTESETWLSKIGGLAGLAITFTVIISSGLWTSLLLRQIMGAFWLALLIPITIGGLILSNHGTALMAEVGLALYSIAGFCWAWWHFNRAQEVAWTGGEINLPEWRSAATGTRAADRSYHPLAALLRKEVQLYKVALMGMAALFVVHLGVIGLRQMLHDETSNSLLMALNEFGGLWLLVPVVTAHLNVADERRLGTMSAHLCLPVSLRAQFVIKLLVTLLLSGFLSALLLWTAESIADAVGASAGFGGTKISHDAEELAYLSFQFLGLTLVVFYASTLARSILHAIAIAVLTAFAFMFLWTSAAGIRWAAGINFWDGPLLEFITVPVMVIAVIWLAYGNYRRLAESRRLWWRNARGLAAAMLFAATLTTFLFHRTWEYLTPLEPAHGPAKLNLSQSLKLRFDWNSLSVAFPDGPLWWQNMGYQAPRNIIPFGENLPVSLGRGKWVGLKGNHFLEGSNWVQLVHTYRGEVGIRTNGTLWVSERPVIPFQEHDGSLIPQERARLIQFGTENDWKSVTRESPSSVLLLKTDGTLWYWGTNQTKDWPGLPRFEPHRLGADSDWAEFLPAQAGLFIWKTNGDAWNFVWSSSPKEWQKAQIILDQYLALTRQENFDKKQWRSFAGGSQMPLAVRADGTLWTFGGTPYNSHDVDNWSKSPMQIGKDTNWVSVVGHFQLMFALKADGTLWKWESQIWNSESVSPYMKPPVRVGKHSDWVALGGSNNGIWTLSADGSLWNWRLTETHIWLTPSRKPVKFANVFEQK